MNKNLVIFSNVFMALAIISISLTVLLVSRLLWIRSEMHTIESTITSIARDGDSHIVMINYRYEGRSYTVRYNTYYASMRVGDKVTIYVNPENPAKYYQANLFTHVFLPGVFAFAFGVVGIPMFISSHKTSRIKSKLMSSGRKILGTVTDIKTNHGTSITIGGSRHFKNHITCSIIDDFTGIEKVYKSRGFWKPSNFDVKLGLSTVDIWIDSQDQENYFVDTDSIRYRPSETLE